MIRRFIEKLTELRDHLDEYPESESNSESGQKPNLDREETTDSQQQLNTLSTKEHVLQNHRETQEALTDDLLLMAQRLRKQQAAFGDAIIKDNKLIDKTGEALSINADKMKNTSSKLGMYSRTRSGTTWLSIGAVLACFAGVFFMIGLIKLT